MRLMGSRLRLFLTLILRYAAANNTRQVAGVVPAARAKDSGAGRSSRPIQKAPGWH